MITQSQTDRIRSALAKSWGLLAGDVIVAVMAPADLVANGSFDSGMTGWTTTGWTYSNTNTNVIHTPGNTIALEQSSVPVASGGVYEITFSISGVSSGSVTPRIGGANGTPISVSGTYSQTITASSADDGLSFVPATGFNGAIDSVSCRLIQKQLLTIAYDYDTGNKFSKGLEIDNAGAMLHDSRQLTFLSSYLDSQLVDIHDIDYWLINGERWDFIEEAPIQTALVPIAGIHNIIVVSVRKAIELIQTDTVTGGFTFE